MILSWLVDHRYQVSRPRLQRWLLRWRCRIRLWRLWQEREAILRLACPQQVLLHPFSLLIMSWYLAEMRIEDATEYNSVAWVCHHHLHDPIQDSKLINIVHVIGLSLTTFLTKDSSIGLFSPLLIVVLSSIGSSYILEHILVMPILSSSPLCSDRIVYCSV